MELQREPSTQLYPLCGLYKQWYLTRQLRLSSDHPDLGLVNEQWPYPFIHMQLIYSMLFTITCNITIYYYVIIHCCGSRCQGVLSSLK